VRPHIQHMPKAALNGHFSMTLIFCSSTEPICMQNGLNDSDLHVSSMKKVSHRVTSVSKNFQRAFYMQTENVK
jgi:hypothetical protein